MNFSPPLILRPGGITLEQLRKVLPNIQVYSKLTSGENLEDKPPTPGLKYRHYSPTASLILYEGSIAAMRLKLEDDATRHVAEGRKVGLIITSTTPLSEPLQALNHIRLGDEEHPLEVAKGLFAALRSFDDMGVDMILMEGISEKDEGLAVMNRARKAASSVVTL
jgi:L-threonylcarbamoyladenylate synthase